MLLHLAVDVHPVHVIPQVEGPDGGVFVVLPALSDGGDGLAVVIEADEAVDEVGGDVEVDGLLAVEHIPALDLAAGGLVGEQLAQALAGGRCTGGCRGGAGSSAGRGAAAAGGQQTGCAHSACALEKAAAGDGVRLKIVVHILSLL